MAVPPLQSVTLVRVVLYYDWSVESRASRDATPEIWFGIRHVALDGRDVASGASYCEQTVEVTLGPKAAFKKGNLSAMTRRVGG